MTNFKVKLKNKQLFLFFFFTFCFFDKYVFLIDSMDVSSMST